MCACVCVFCGKTMCSARTRCCRTREKGNCNFLLSVFCKHKISVKLNCMFYEVICSAYGCQNFSVAAAPVSTASCIKCAPYTFFFLSNVFCVLSSFACLSNNCPNEYFEPYITLKTLIFS